MCLNFLILIFLMVLIEYVFYFVLGLFLKKLIEYYVCYYNDILYIGIKIFIGDSSLSFL